MSSILSMKSKLKPLGLYNLGNDSLINAELSAYAEGLDMIEQKLEELERECFISTAISYGISIRERLFGTVKDYLEIEKRRKDLIFKNSVTSNDNTKKDMEESMLVCGMDGYMLESKGTNSLYFNCTELLDGITENAAVNDAEKFLPIHLDVYIDLSTLSWSRIDEDDLSFSEIDSNDLTWSQIDNFRE